MAISLLLLPTVNALRINEIMYDPQYNENYNEWIELYNDEDSPVDLTGYTLCGKTILGGFVDSSGIVYHNETFLLAPGSYALITDGGSGTEVYTSYTISPEALAFHVSAASLCGGLANSGDTIVIASDNVTLVEISYTNEAQPGFSLEFIDGAFSPSAEIDGTPGRENSAGYEPPEEDPENNSAPPLNGSEEEDEEVSTNTARETSVVPSFIPLRTNDSNYQQETKTAPAKKKITLTSQKSPPPVKEEVYITPEGRIRQTVIYSFAGFCIVLTLLIVLKKV